MVHEFNPKGGSSKKKRNTLVDRASGRFVKRKTLVVGGEKPEEGLSGEAQAEFYKEQKYYVAFSVGRQEVASFFAPAIKKSSLEKNGAEKDASALTEKKYAEGFEEEKKEKEEALLKGKEKEEPVQEEKAPIIRKKRERNFLVDPKTGRFVARKKIVVGTKKAPENLPLEAQAEFYKYQKYFVAFSVERQEVETAYAPSPYPYAEKDIPVGFEKEASLNTEKRYSLGFEEEKKAEEKTETEKEPEAVRPAKEENAPFEFRDEENGEEEREESYPEPVILGRIDLGSGEKEANLHTEEKYAEAFENEKREEEEKTAPETETIRNTDDSLSDFVLKGLGKDDRTVGDSFLKNLAAAPAPLSGEAEDIERAKEKKEEAKEFVIPLTPFMRILPGYSAGPSYKKEGAPKEAKEK